jgi:N-acetylmuramoyl-L-alanine amidase
MKGIDLFNLLTKHKGEPYSLGALVPKANPNWKGFWDCAEFVAWGIFQLTSKLFGCVNNNGNPNSADAYTGFIARDAATIGTKISINDAFKTAGALLLRVAANGLVGHVVVSDGRGGTVEAHSHRDGVINSVISGRRWDYGVLVPGIEYEQTAIHEDAVKAANQKPTGVIYRFTSPLMTGPDVVRIQERFISLGFPVGASGADGKYGSNTMFAAKAFQNQHGLNPDGEVGKYTMQALGL